MTIELIEFVNTLKREVVPLGSTAFATVSNQIWVGYLGDAFWEAKLDGFLPNFTEADGQITSLPEGSDIDLDRAQISLLVMYAGVKILRNHILNTKTSFRSKAGPVEFEQQQSATVLAEALRSLNRRKELLLDQAQVVGSAVAMYDLFSSRGLLGVEGGYYADVQLVD